MPYDVTVRRLEMQAVLDLKGPAQAMGAWLARAGLTLPGAPNTATRAGGRDLYWIGPDHWLLRAPIEGEDALLGILPEAEAPPALGQVLVSDAYAFFAVTGPDAGQILAIASPLDTYPAVFPANGAAFTEAFGLKALVILRAEGFDADGFDLAVERSYTDMVADYLARIAPP